MTEDKKRVVPIMCCVQGCANDPWEGSGEFIVMGSTRMWICSPCLEFLLENTGENSILFRNAMDKSKCVVPDPNRTVDPTTNEV